MYLSWLNQYSVKKLFISVQSRCFCPTAGCVSYEFPMSETHRRHPSSGVVSGLLAGRSIRLPTYIDYAGSANGAGAGVTYTLGGSDSDDKLRKYRHGLRDRIIKKAKNANGWVGALLRLAIRAGIVQGQFWRRTGFIVLFCAFVGVRQLLKVLQEVCVS